MVLDLPWKICYAKGVIKVRYGDEIKPKAASVVRAAALQLWSLLEMHSMYSEQTGSWSLKSRNGTRALLCSHFPAELLGGKTWQRQKSKHMVNPGKICSVHVRKDLSLCLPPQRSFIPIIIIIKKTLKKCTGDIGIGNYIPQGKKKRFFWKASGYVTNTINLEPQLRKCKSKLKGSL